VESMDQCWRAQERMRDCVKFSQRRRLQHLQTWEAVSPVKP
jgi:hypothetical protein